MTTPDAKNAKTIAEYERIVAWCDSSFQVLSNAKHIARTVNDTSIVTATETAQKAILDARNQALAWLAGS